LNSFGLINKTPTIYMMRVLWSLSQSVLDALG
jgi:hypothetical protein